MGHFEIWPDIDLTCDFKKENFEISLKCTLGELLVATMRVSLRLLVRKSLPGIGTLNVPQQIVGRGGKYPGFYRNASKIDRVWDEKRRNLSRYFLAGTAVRVLETFYTKVDSNFTSEPNAEPAKEV